MNEHIKTNAPIRHVLLMLHPEEASPELSAHRRCRFTARCSRVFHNNLQQLRHHSCVSLWMARYFMLSSLRALLSLLICLASVSKLAKQLVYRFSAKGKILQTHQGHLLNGQWVRDTSTRALDSTPSLPIRLSGSESRVRVAEGMKQRQWNLQNRLPGSVFSPAMDRKV